MFAGGGVGIDDGRGILVCVDGCVVVRGVDAVGVVVRAVGVCAVALDAQRARTVIAVSFFMWVSRVRGIRVA